VYTHLVEHAGTSRDKPSAIVQDAINLHAHVQAAGAMPAITTMKRIVRRQRSIQLGTTPPDPETINDLPDHIPDQFITVRWNEHEIESTVKYDSGRGPERFIILSTTRAIRLMRTAKDIFCDGTFRISAKCLYQVYIVIMSINGIYVLSAIGLLPAKSEAIYTRFLNQLQMMTGMRPETVMSDLELPFINATQKVLPETQVNTCAFHLCQAVWRKVVELGMASRYSNDPDFEMEVRTLPALAYLPTKDVVSTYGESYKK
jgi:hypothetical protein